MSASSLSSVIEFISSVEFFQPLDSEALTTVAMAMETEVFSEGESLVLQGERGDAMFIVVSGRFRAFVHKQTGVVELGHIGEGQPVGEMQFVGGGTRSASVIAETESKVYRLAYSVFDTLPMESQLALSNSPIAQKRLHRSHLASVLPKIFGPIDLELREEIEQTIEWVNLKRGQALFHQGDESDGWYLVLAGRLRVVMHDAQSNKEIAVAELGRGESIGEVAIITGEQRSATPYALRDSLLVRFPAYSFQKVMERHPQVLLFICRTLIKRNQNAVRHSGAKSRLVITVTPAGNGKLTPEFSCSLKLALETIGTALHVNAQILSEVGVIDATADLPADHPKWLHFSAWLEEQQDQYDFIILETDQHAGGWTERALGQSDHVVIIGDATSDCALGEIEQKLLSFDASTDVRRARRTLVLVHPQETILPNGTHKWLALRNVDRHLHVRSGSQADSERVARMITGRAVGVALGGGGARGFAHLGVVKALRELGIPIDLLGGTSMGAIMAAQLSSGRSLDQIFELNRSIIAINPFKEYTVPMIALLKTAKITKSAQMSFGDTRIEDLWLPYFAISSNLTTAEMVVIESGSVWEATRASGAIPGILLPVVRGKHLLVDGGIINNLPGDIMRIKSDEGVVIVVDVSPEEDVAMSMDGFPSPWEIFWSRVLPFKKRIAVPGLLDILMRTTMLASANRTYQVKRNADLYLRPPIDKFEMLDFAKLTEFVDIGYKYTLEAAAEWKPPKE